MPAIGRRGAVVIALAGISGARAQTPVRVLCSTALQAAMGPIGTGFAAAQGSPAAVTFATTGAILTRLHAGEAWPVVIATRGALAALAEEGRIAPASLIGIATMEVGIAVRRGQPRPDIATAESLRAALLGNRVAYSAPGSGGTSGVHFADVLERLGITEAFRAKAVPVSGGGSVGEVVARGEADLGVQMMSELMAVPDVEVLGPLPAPLGSATPLAVGVAPGAVSTEAQAFIAYLRSAPAQDAMRRSGLSASA